MTERDQLRTVFIESFRKYREKLPLEPIESQLVNIILQHPEYHNVLTDPDFTSTDFIDDNPFLHLSLHLALHEQITTNRPDGIRDIYLSLCKKFGDAHTAEHKMIECLSQILWDAQQLQRMPDEKNYIELLTDLIH